MAWVVTSPQIGFQPITDTSTTQNHPLGTRINAKDSTQGEGEFIYLLGVASTVAGSLVKYNATTYQTALTISTANQAVPVAAAMSANVASQYGWYQIGGNAVIKKTAVVVNPQVTLFLSSANGAAELAGRVKVIASAGLQILGARSANLASVAAATSTVTVTINHPHLQGQIT